MPKKAKGALPAEFYARVTGKSEGLDGFPRLRGVVNHNGAEVCSWQEDDWVGPMTMKWRSTAAEESFRAASMLLPEDPRLSPGERLVYALVDETAGARASCRRGIVLVPLDGSENCVLIGARWDPKNRSLRSWLAREWPGHKVLNKEMARG